jgi:hypothetical protein
MLATPQVKRYPAIYTSGGIGRHAGLRNQCFTACGFESHLVYKLFINIVNIKKPKTKWSWANYFVKIINNYGIETVIGSPNTNGPSVLAD